MKSLLGMKSLTQSRDFSVVTGRACGMKRAKPVNALERFSAHCHWHWWRIVIELGAGVWNTRLHRSLAHTACATGTTDVFEIIPLNAGLAFGN
jgi:hypothetical protein